MKRGWKRVSPGLLAEWAAQCAACALDAKHYAKNRPVTQDRLVLVCEHDKTTCAGFKDGRIEPVYIHDVTRRKLFTSGEEAEAWLDSIEEIPFELYDLQWMSEAMREAARAYATKIVNGLVVGVAPTAGQARKKRKST